MNIKNILIVSVIAVGAVLTTAALSQRFREFVVTGGRTAPVE